MNIRSSFMITILNLNCCNLKNCIATIRELNVLNQRLWNYVMLGLLIIMNLLPNILNFMLW